MSKGKSVFVTVLIAAMLVLIDIGLYIISKTGFVALTGTLAVYGYFRGAGDFWHWLAKEPPAKCVPVIEPVNIPKHDDHRAFDWAQDGDLFTAKAAQHKSSPPIYDVLIVDEAQSYQS